MKLQKGVREVTCRECGAVGTIRIGATLSRGRRVKVSENVPHLETCPHYVRAQPRHLKQKKWQKQEKKMNQQMGTRDTLASGAVGKDGDGRAFHQWRAEAKQTEHSSFRLTHEVWEKLVKGALLAGEEPVLFLQLTYARSRIRRVVIRRDLWDAVGDEELRKVEGFTNKKSFRIAHDHPLPLQVDHLNPPGVLLAEEHFLNIKDSLE